MKSLMKNLKYIIPLLVFIFLTFFLLQGLKHDPHTIPSPLIGKPVPAFSAHMLFEPKQTITNQIFKGHVSLLNVFATWCVSCRSEHPVLIDMKNSHQVNIYGLNYRDSRKSALSWLKQYGNPYVKIIFDPLGKTAIDLGVYGTPETFVIDQYGIIRNKYIGAISPEIWRNKILPEIKALQREAT